MVEIRQKSVRAASSRRSLLVCAGVSVVRPLALLAQNNEKPKESFAIISVSVFREPGFSLSGAETELQPDPQGKPSKRVKKMKAVADRRGELNFRVPAVPMRYKLSITAAGYQSESREVTISGEERQDVFVTLKPVKEESK